MPLTALVTGATAGFGAAIARRFVAEGAAVVGTGRRRERLDALQVELGERFTPLPFDVTDADEVQRAVDGLGDRAIDVLVNNAGLALGLEPAWQAELRDWQTMIATNCTGLVAVTRAVLPGMVQRGSGHLVNIGSTAGAWPYAGGNVYGATKAFVAQFTRNLRADLLGEPIRVTNIAPGLAETEFSLVRFKGDAERAGAAYEGAGALTAEDIAEAAWWVCTQPPHVNVNHIELMPTSQAWAGLRVERGN